MIDFRRGHTAIVGMTGTGKTYAAKKALSAWTGGVLFVNTMHGERPQGFIDANGSSDMDTVIEALSDGDKINFLPDRDGRRRERQLTAIVRELMQFKRKNIILAVDEVHLYRGDALHELIGVATTGRQWGVTLVSITQRLKNVHNDIMTQSPQKVIFSLENEGPYFERYGIPYGEIEPMLHQHDPPRRNPPEPSHAYAVYYLGQIEGPFLA